MHTLFSTILEFYVNNPTIPPHLLNSVVDILGALIIILPEEGHQCIGSFPPFLSSPDRLFYLCQQGTIKADVFIQICASLPSLSKRLANYFSAPFHDESRLGCISQEAFDTKWIDFRQTSFQYVDAILASLQLEQLLAIPALFQAACQMLSSWYLLSHNESLDAFSDDYFFEEAVKAQTAVSTRQ